MVLQKLLLENLLILIHKCNFQKCKFLLRPKEKICVFPVTSKKKIG